jgi:hypothetical protein
LEEIHLNRWLIIVLAGCLLAACTPPTAPATVMATATNTPVPPTATVVLPSPTAPALTLTQLKNMTYTLKASASAVPITLVDGKFQVSDTANNLRMSGALVEPVAFGDLDGDGVPDAAVIIATNNGGSGTFHELIAVLSKNGQPVQAANLILGDRISEKLLTIQGGKIALDYLRSGPKDPLCCPSEHALTTYHLAGGQLAVVNDQVLP